MAGKVIIDITNKERIFINGRNGNRVTKLGKHGVEITNSREGGGDKGTQETTGDKTKEEAKKDLSLDKLSSDEQDQLKSLMAKLNV